MTLGFRTPNKNSSLVLGELSGFNFWSFSIKAEEILRMSHGCGGEAGDVKAWKTVRGGLKKEVAVKWIRSCRDIKGKWSMKSECTAAGPLKKSLLICPFSLIIARRLPFLIVPITK